MKLSYMLLAALLCCSSTLRPTITHIAEFHNPATQRSIILMGDNHFVLPEVDGKQRDDLVEAMNCAHAPLITETTAQLDSQSFTNEITLLGTLHKACKEQRVDVYGIEFRRSYTFLVYLIEHK
jgi:hypothetical protein